MTKPLIIIGAGPGGLSCATTLAQAGRQVVVLERKEHIGPKVCAGGLGYSDFCDSLPADLTEKRFPSQHIFTPCQRTVITAQQPIIVTVNRQKLGQHMASKAIAAGVEIRTSCHVKEITAKNITYLDKQQGRLHTMPFDHLVGADGSVSAVRRHLGLATDATAIAINYQIPGDVDKMEWHMDAVRFRNGYAWIFPHRHTISIGAYVDCRQMRGNRLKKGLIAWAKDRGHDLSCHAATADYINFDYRGWRFGNFFLVGDAAGLASGLTGEGIYPAIVSGEAVGRFLIDPASDLSHLQRLIANQQKHARLVRLTGRSTLIARLLAEIFTAGLRLGLIDFSKLEVAR